MTLCHTAQMMELWTGMARCPAEDCDFIIRIDSDSEADIDVSAMAAFEAHATYRHPGVPLDMMGYRSSGSDRTASDRKLVN